MEPPLRLAAWAALGEQLGVACPTMRSLVELIGTMLETDFWQTARTPEDLGIAGLDRDGLLAFLQ